MSITVPPIKCQGIKTKLLPAIRPIVPERIEGRWIEPFCGSGVVAFNLLPERALLADTNRHIIALYQAIQAGRITPGSVQEFLRAEGAVLKDKGEAHYYAVRERFNAHKDSLDFLFLNRSCFNGVMRFNRKGGFNTPFCRKPERFQPAYVTKIVNQVRSVAQIVSRYDWVFRVSDFRETLAEAKTGDFVYADPPYAGRHTDYFNGWTSEDEEVFIRQLKGLPCTFLLSTWQENTFRRNPAIDSYLCEPGLVRHTVEHFYHVGSQEELRHAMTEALITNAERVGAAEATVRPRQFALEMA
ncbi:MAG: Dam family site-specific DNA-(adenine-N6)-methyltransferase [Armatimonadetes bacterium]|nr:Dam family site-specific DNA-(adenine-N6)-methyltransferase [Armatimonadota bacterium]